MGQQDKGMLKQLRGNRGFTLVELMVVMAVLGILSAIGVLGYTDFTARANDSTAMTDAKFLMGLASNVLLQDSQTLFSHQSHEGTIIGDRNDSLGIYVPKLYKLSPGVQANVQIFNWDVPADPPFEISSIWVEASHDRGSDMAGGLNGKKTYQVWVDGVSGWIWKNF